MKALGTVETLLPVYLQLRELDLALLAAGRKALKPLEAVLRALSLTFMSRTNPVSLWSTARLLLHAEVVELPGADRRAAVHLHTTVAVGDQVALTEEAPSREVEVNEEVQGGGGEIGTRCPDCLPLWYTVIDLRSSLTGRSCSRVLCCN